MKKVIFIAIIVLFTGKIYSQPLSGQYSVGPSQNYTTINDAVNALINNGVSGPVTFIIYDGNYYEDLYIPNINGASATNTITFRPKTEDSTLVHIIGSSTSTVTLDRADYIRFRWVTIENSSNHAVTLINGATNNIIANCQLIGDVTTSTDISHALVYSQSTYDPYNTFEYTRFVGGSYGIYLLGDSNQKEEGTVIRNNKLYSQSYFGMYLSNQDSPLFYENEISIGNTGVRSIYLIYSNSIIIEKNKTFEGSIMLESCNSSYGNESYIINNFVKSQNGSGIVESNSSYIYCAHNSVYQHGPSQPKGAFYSNNSYNCITRNNIFSSFGSGCAYYINAGEINSDYNVLFSNNYLIYDNGNYTNDFSNWSYSTGNDYHSILTEPLFNSSIDFHLSQSNIDGQAIPLSYVQTDIDGESRDPVHPDIGADEFTITNSLFFNNNPPDILIYPIPANKYIKILSLSSPINKIIMYNVQGQIIFTLKYNEPIYIQKITKSNYQLNSGIYLIKIFTDKSIVTKKIIIE